MSEIYTSYVRRCAMSWVYIFDSFWWSARAFFSYLILCSNVVTISYLSLFRISVQIIWSVNRCEKSEMCAERRQAERTKNWKRYKVYLLLNKKKTRWTHREKEDEKKLKRKQQSSSFERASHCRFGFRLCEFGRGENVDTQRSLSLFLNRIRIGLNWVPA